jgi:porin
MSRCGRISTLRFHLSQSLAAAAIGVGLICGCTPHAQAASDTAAATQQPAPQAEPDPPEALGDERPGQPPRPLDGDFLQLFHKERQDLKDKGITFSLHERREIWTDVSGGGHQGFSYDGLTIAKLNLDLDALLGWKGGEFFASGFDIHGHGPSRALVGNQQLVSNIEATPSIKLYDLWLDQTLLDGKVSIRTGQEGANDEMMVTAYGGLFLNSSFGFPGMPAADLPSGGPNYPLASPFVRALYSPTDKITIVGAVYTEDPAQPGVGDPQARDRNGTAFRLNDHTLGFAELWYTPDAKSPPDLPTTYKLGAWYATGNFADRRLDSAGGLLANPASSGSPLQHAGDWAVYGVVDQMVWRQPGTDDDGIGVFAMVMAGPGNRNLSNLYAEAGMNWRGPFKERKDDVFGLAVAYLGISPAARQYGNDLVAFGQANAGYASNETVIEATYQAPVTDWLTLQPDLQYVVNPNAGIPNNFGARPLPNALVIGMRVTIRL